MRIWLVTIGEPWPTDGPNVRLLRTGLIAKQLAQAGDDVVWFNETFDHATRTHLGAVRRTSDLEPHLQVVGLRGRGYGRSISISRIGHHRDVARDFQRIASGRERPDVIVASLTPLELCREAIRYGRIHHVPVVVDIRDLWPDIWVDVAPKAFRPLARMALTPYFRMLSEIIGEATAICGISEEAIDWALSHSPRPRNAFDGALPLAYQPPHIAAADLAAAERFWSDAGITGDDGKLTICFFGTFSRRIEFDTVIDAMRSAPMPLRQRLRIVMCGAGESEAKLSAAAQSLDMIHLPGWVNAAQIEVLKARSHAGLLPYPSEIDFMRSIPNKVFDYLMGALPILTCLKGVTANLVQQNGCGWMYENRNPDSLIKVLERLVEDRQEVARAAAAAGQVGKRYDAQEVYGRFRTRLEDIVGTATTPRDATGR